MAETITQGIITLEQVRQWKDEHSRLASEIEEKERRRKALSKLIDAAEEFMPAQSALNLTPEPTKPKEQQSTPTAPPRISARRAGRVTWTGTIEDILKQEDGPMTFSELKEKLKQTPLASKLARNEKSFYGAAYKLEEQERLKRHNGYLFSPMAFARFHRKLESGMIQDLPNVSRPNTSPIADEIKEILLKQGSNGATAAELKEELCRNPEHAKSVKRNHSFIYNVLKRLVDREEIDKDRDNGVYYSKETPAEARVS